MVYFDPIRARIVRILRNLQSRQLSSIERLSLESYLRFSLLGKDELDLKSRTELGESTIFLGQTTYRNNSAVLNLSASIVDDYIIARAYNPKSRDRNPLEELAIKAMPKFQIPKANQQDQRVALGSITDALECVVEAWTGVDIQKRVITSCMLEDAGFYVTRLFETLPLCKNTEGVLQLDPMFHDGTYLDRALLDLAISPKSATAKSYYAHVGPKTALIYSSCCLKSF